MTFKRITMADLAFGEPLRWDIFSAPSPGQPVMQKGQMLSPGQLDGWLDGGLYAEAAPTVLQALNQVNRRLEHTLNELRQHGSADSALRALAHDLIAAVARDPDIALASVLLNQIGGAYAIRHCTEAAIVASLIGRAMDKSAAEALIITAAALTMNVGMVNHGDTFHNREGALSSEERAQVRRHPAAGVDMLRFAGIDDEQWLDLVLLHHENDDGSGYPQGKLGSEISQNAKLIGLADRYCAFVSARNYRRSLLPPVALDKLREETAMPFDQSLVEHFRVQIGAYPPGTLVRLANGETGVVKGRLDDDAVCVHVLRDGGGAGLNPAALRSSAEPGCTIAEALHEDAAQLRFAMKQIWGELASL